MTTDVLDERNQDHWEEIVEGSSYGPVSAAKLCGITCQTFRNWLSKKQKPQKSRRERIEKVMSQLKNSPRLQKHPSYGWAYPEQIEELNRIGIGPRRDQILKDIAAQTKRRGKKK